MTFASLRAVLLPSIMGVYEIMSVLAGTEAKVLEKNSPKKPTEAL